MSTKYHLVPIANCLNLIIIITPSNTNLHIIMGQTTQKSDDPSAEQEGTLVGNETVRFQAGCVGDALENHSQLVSTRIQDAALHKVSQICRPPPLLSHLGLSLTSLQQPGIRLCIQRVSPYNSLASAFLCSQWASKLCLASCIPDSAMLRRSACLWQI